jgi:hypothetical protein
LVALRAATEPAKEEVMQAIVGRGGVGACGFWGCVLKNGERQKRRFVQLGRKREKTPLLYSHAKIACSRAGGWRGDKR